MLQYPQTDFPFSLRGGSDIWDDESAGGQIFRGEFFQGATLLQFWAGSQWGIGTLKRWDGTRWVDARLKRYNASTWVPA